MVVWLVTVGEPLPTDGMGDRLHRSGVLAETLVAAGHKVLWWTSTFDHVRKRHRFQKDTTVEVNANLRIRLLKSLGYQRNVSLRRFADHYYIARKFARLVTEERKPDVIVASLPTLELASAAAAYGKRESVPVAVDVRDLWPDIFLELLPEKTRHIGRVILSPMFRTVRKACREATALLGATDSFVEWGVSYAGRNRTNWDRAFPFGYTKRAFSHNELEAARTCLAEKGVPLSEGKMIGCFFGAFGRQFDFTTVIKAAKLLYQSRRDICLVLCGEGESLPRIREDSREVPNVVLPGWVGEAEIAALMQASSFGLAPYIQSENFTRNIPNKVAEYLSAGLPVLSTLTGEVQALVDRYHCGYTCEAGKPENLVGYVCNLQDHPELRKAQSGNARNLFEERFEGVRVYRSMASFLKELADA